MKKTLAAALAAIALIGAVAVSTQDAEARRWGRGFGIGLGIGLLSAGSYAYGSPYYVRQCQWVERYDRYGNYRGVREVCAVVPY